MTQAIKMKARSQVPYLERLIEFADPSADDFALDLSHGPGPVAPALLPLVGHVAACDLAVRPEPAPADAQIPTIPDVAACDLAVRPGPAPADAGIPTTRARPDALPYQDRGFTLVTARFSLYRTGDPGAALREMLRVCRPDGRIVIADLIRPNLARPDRDRIEWLRDPHRPRTPSVARLVDLVTDAGADVNRLEVFTVERPLRPWLGQAAATQIGRHIEDLLIDEVDGGPKTGAKPRLIGGELWFTQSWIHLAASPLSGS